MGQYKKHLLEASYNIIRSLSLLLNKSELLVVNVPSLNRFNFAFENDIFNVCQLKKINFGQRDPKMYKYFELYSFFRYSDSELIQFERSVYFCSLKLTKLTIQ